jgi:hypothetical protein
MELESEILAIRSKAQVNDIIHWVGHDPARLHRLMNLLLNGDSRLSQQSSWAIGHIGESDPDLVRPFLKKLLVKISDDNSHPSVRRNVLRAFQFADIPKALQGRVATLCFEYLSSLDQPIAVRALSISILEQLSVKEPELKRELEMIVRQMLPYGTAAFRARARRVLKGAVPDTREG